MKRKLLLATLSLLLPLTVFAAGADWDSYIKDPNYTVIAENGAAYYDKDTGKVEFNGGDPILIELYKKGQEDGDPVLYQELNAKFSVPSSYVSTIPKNYESISFKPVSNDGGVVYHADRFERVRQKSGIGRASGSYSGGMGTGPMAAGEAYGSIRWSLEYDYTIRIVSEAVWPLEYTIQSGGEVMNRPEYIETAMAHRQEYENSGWSYHETNLSGRRTIYRERVKEESIPNQGEVLLSDSIDYSQGISVGTVGGKTNNSNGRTVSYGSEEHRHDVSYAVIDQLPTVPGFYAVILIDTYDGYEELLAPTGRVRSEAGETRGEYFALRDTVMSTVPADIAATKMEFFWGKEKISDPVIKETITEAKKESGEDEGADVPGIIVDGDKPDLTLPIGFAVLFGGAAAALALKNLKKDQEEAEEREQYTYKMYVNKTFGDELRTDEPPRYVYARMAEITPQGAERDRPDLTEKIRPFSGDNVLIVTDAGMTENGYRAAKVQVPENCDRNEGEVSFQFVGKGGTFTRHVVFRIIEARIDFGQENLGLPAHFEEETRLPFDVIGMPEETEVTAYFRAEEDGKPVYDVKLEQDEKRYWRWEALIRDVLPNDEKEPGTTRIYTLHIRAEAPAGSGSGANLLQEKTVVETTFPVIRIHMGLSLALESDAIGCFQKVKEGVDVVWAAGHDAGWNVSAACAPGLNPQTALILSGVSSMVDMTASAANPKNSKALLPEDMEPCVTKGKILLLRYNKKEQVIERVAVYPETVGEEKLPLCGVTVLKLENTKNSQVGAPDTMHQNIADALKICAFPTNEIDENGARTLKICAAAAALDPPTRMKAELKIKVRYQPDEKEPPEEYEVKKTVLLHSMPFRNFRTEEEADEYYKWDKHVGEVLASIEYRIYHNYMYNLNSLHDMVVRMQEGYDRRFGYDYNQLNHVMDLWTGFLKGKMPGARGETEKLTLADDLAAAYAFMQGMRDNGGLLGRFALGICTAGYSEMVFFAMDLGEKMKEAVFACKDNEFGFWDGVVMGIKEYEKQLAAEYLFNAGFKKLGQTTNAWINSLKKDPWGEYIDIGDVVLGGYRNVMDSIDDALKETCRPYQSAAKNFDSLKSYFNSISGAAADSISRDADLNARAEARVEAKLKAGKRKTTIAERRAGKGKEWRSPEDWASSLDDDLAREQGMEDVRKLWETQQARSKSRAVGGDAYVQANKDFEEACKQVWRNKNALKALKNYDGVHAADMKIEFNRYRSKIRQRTAEKTLDDIAAQTGKRREDLYMSSATSNSSLDEAMGKSVPEDWDVTFTEVNFSDLKRQNSFAIDDPTVPKNILAQSKENIYLTIDQKLAEQALARNLHKEVYGFEADTIEQAVAAMKKLDVTYVQPVWTKGHKIELNPEAYADLAGMIDKSQIGRELKALGMNRKTFAHKGNEWYRAAEKLYAQSADLVAKAGGLSGEAKEKLLKAALNLRLEAVACNIEGTRQITKQVTKIAMPRNEYRVSRGMRDAFSENAREIHALAKKVGTEIGPDEFFHILRTDYGIDKYGYTKMMSECLV